MHQVWLKSLFTCYRPETKKWACLGQITSSKFEEICRLAIPIQIFTITMHIPSLVKIHRRLLKLSSGNENMGVYLADNSVKIWQICPLAIPNQISIISMHIPNLVKIHLMFTQVIIRKRKQTDGWTTDGWTDGHTDVQHETIIPCHYIVAGYKKSNKKTIWQLYPNHMHILIPWRKRIQCFKMIGTKL